MANLTPNLFDPPPKYVLPLALGGDLSVQFRNNPSGDGTTFVDYAVGDALTLYIDTNPQITADATISGSTAEIKIEATQTDTIPATTKWRLILSAATTPTTETVVAYGTVKRFD